MWEVIADWKEWGRKHERGVAIILDQDMGKTAQVHWTPSDQILLLKIAGKPLDLNITQKYTPTSTSSNDDIEKVYEDLYRGHNTMFPTTENEL